MRQIHETIIIFTCQDDSADLCLNEMLLAGLKFKLIKWLDLGVGLLGCEDDFQTFSGRVKSGNLIFLRHIFPVEHIFDLGQGFDNIRNELGTAVREYAMSTDAGLSIGVQLRRNSRNTLKSECDLGEISRTILSGFQKPGIKHEVKDPKMVLSGYINENLLYIGMSSAGANLSSWPGGMRRYAFTADTVSRAEFKLLEALEYFSIGLSRDMLAVDLGAAPGGWTKVMADRGLKVTAVDPAEMAKQVCDNPFVTHYRGTAQEFLADNSQTFDVVTNDMKMDVAPSAKIMNQMASALKPNAHAVMTFKLEKSKKMQAIKHGIEILGAGYNVLFAKQLFNNRSEVTVIARRK